MTRHKSTVKYGTKICTHCEERLPLDMFWKRSARPEGVQSRCIDCSKAYSDTYRQTDSGKEARRKAQAKYRVTDKGKATQRGGYSRWKMKYGFGRLDMDSDDKLISRYYREAIQNDPCFYCGEHREVMEDDHFFPISKGGSDHWFNLVRSCQQCNRGVSGKFDSCGTSFILKKGGLR